MSRKLLYATLVAALAAVLVVAFALPASAEQRTFRVQLAGGSVITVTVDAACGPMDQVPGLPGSPIEDLTPPNVCPPSDPPAGLVPTTPAPTTTTPSTPANPPTTTGPTTNNGGNSGGKPSSGHGHRQNHSGSRNPANVDHTGGNTQAQGQGQTKKKHKKKVRRSDGVPTPANPTFFDALPGPSPVHGVPNFVIQKFKVPIFLLPIYQAAGIQYGVRWEVLAGINEIETDYGRNLNVSSAGAVGWMQFMPATWKMYGVDANKDGKRDPYNPVDAIFAAARYLKAAGAPDQHPQGGLRLQPRRLVRRQRHAPRATDRRLPARLRGLADRPHRGPLPHRRSRQVRRRRRRARHQGAREGRPERRARDRLLPDPARHRHLLARGRRRRRDERRSGEGHRSVQERRALHRDPGRVRQPVHVLAARLGPEDVPGAEPGRGP